jgi:polysaccharide biosynthesis transport protein
MAQRTPSNVRDYVEIVRRRKWWLIIPVVALSFGTFFLSLCLPRYYRSETTIMVEPQQVPTNYIPSATSSKISDRLQAMNQEILSHTRLQKIIDQYGLYRDWRPKVGGEDAVDEMRRDIAIEVINSDQPGPDRNKTVIAFTISYTGKDPAVAQQVTRQLASLFIEENLKDREQEAEGTTDFLDTELEETRQSLQQQEDKIKAFKIAHSGELPEQQQGDLQLLGQLQSMLQANGDALTRAQEQKNYLSALRDSLKQMTPQSGKSTLATQYENKRAELIAARQKYRDKHPDVVHLEAELKELKAQVDQQKPETQAGQQSPEQVQSEIDGLADEINKRSARQKELEQQIGRMHGQMAALPHVEQELAGLTRDYDISKTNYQTLLAKRDASSMAADVERHAKGEQFRILDPATYPALPSKPNLARIDLMGLLFGLLVGAGLTLAVELSDYTVHNEEDVTFYTSLPMLASIPLVLNAHELQQKRMRQTLTVAACAALVLITSVAAYLLRSSIAAGFGWWF